MHTVDFKRQKCCSNPPFVRDTIHIARAYIMVNGKSIIVSCTRIFLGTKRTHAKNTHSPRAQITRIVFREGLYGTKELLLLNF